MPNTALAMDLAIRFPRHWLSLVWGVVSHGPFALRPRMRHSACFIPRVGGSSHADHKTGRQDSQTVDSVFAPQIRTNGVASGTG